MLQTLKQQVFEANLEIVRQGLVTLTWGNAGAIDRRNGLVVIKPSGLPYEDMRAEDMAVIDMDGKLVEGEHKPSVDAPTHLALYKAFETIGGIVHTHSQCATAWAQACRPIPCLGTTHADLAHGPVPVTDSLTPDEVAADYETNIGHVIVRKYANQGLDPERFPVVLVANHGPFAWGRDVRQAVRNAVALEAVARLALDTLHLSPNQAEIPQRLLDTHFFRKHGKHAYYGQKQD